MTEPSGNRWWNRHIALVAIVGGVTTLAVAVLADSLLASRLHTRSGAIVAGWLVFYLAMANLWYRRMRGNSEPYRRRRSS